MLANPWEVGGGRSVLDRENMEDQTKPKIPTQTGLFSSDGYLVGKKNTTETTKIYVSKLKKDEAVKKYAASPSEFEKLCDTINCSLADLQMYAGIVFQEQKEANREERFALASAIKNFQTRAIEFESTRKDFTIAEIAKSISTANHTPLNPSSNANVALSFEACINALLGGFDYSYGATHWDGFDFAGKGFKHTKVVNNGIVITTTQITQLNTYWNATIPNETMDYYAKGADGKPLKGADGKVLPPKTVPKTRLRKIGGSQYDYSKLYVDPNGATRYPVANGKRNEGKILHKATVIYNGHIFWAPNIGGTLTAPPNNTVTYPNADYQWKYLYQ
jgi:hypothetical protein